MHRPDLAWTAGPAVMSTTERFQALKEAKRGNRLGSLEFFGNKSPKCPHCRADYSIEEHEAWRLYEEGEHEAECGRCSQEFRVSTRISYSFSTDNQDDEQ